MEDYLESCVQVKVDVDGVERLLWPENLEVSQRYVLSHAIGGSSNTREAEPLRGKQKTMVGKSGRDGARQESGRNEWHGIE